jgi:hypothetical protein
MGDDGTTFNVRVYQTEVYKGAEVTTYKVRWKVGARLWKQGFRNAAQADSFRSALLTAARKGEAFSLATGKPTAWERAKADTSWYEFACAYVDMKWKQASAKYRKDIARALTAATPAMLAEARGRPDDAGIRRALMRWGFNTKQRSDPPDDAAEVLDWLARNTAPVSTLIEPATARRMLDLATGTVDGRNAAASTVRRHASSWPTPWTTRSNAAYWRRTRSGCSSGRRPRYPARWTGDPSSTRARRGRCLMPSAPSSPAGHGWSPSSR